MKYPHRSPFGFAVRLLVLAAVTVSVPAQAKLLAQGVAFRGVTVVDVADGSLHRNWNVIVSGDRIAAAGPMRKVAIPAGTEIVDGAGKFLIPGLWDMHVHTSWERTAQAYYPLFIANGITGVRDMWGKKSVAAEAQAAVKEGRVVGPRIVIAGTVIDGPGRPLPQTVRALTPEEGRKFVDSLHAEGEPFIKVYSSISPDTYLAIAARARELGIPIAGHVPEAVSAATASNAGQRSMEHMIGIVRGCSSEEESLTDEFMRGMAAALKANPRRFPVDILVRRDSRILATQDEARCRRLAATLAGNKTWQTPTFVTMRGLAYMREPSARQESLMRYVPPEALGIFSPDTHMWRKAWTADFERVAQASYERSLKIIPMMRRAGVPFLAGTDAPDAGAIPGFALHDELELLVKAGLTPLEALQAATINPARYFERTRDLGTVTKGKYADLVLLDANPLKDITNTRRINAVVANGRLYRQAQLDAVLAEVETKNRNRATPK